MAFSFSSIKNLGCSPEPSEILFFFFAFFPPPKRQIKSSGHSRLHLESVR